MSRRNPCEREDQIHVLCHHLAHEGQAALQAALAIGPDAVVLDIGLPGMDGYPVARQLRASRDMDKAILVAVTGYGRDEDRVKALEAGFDFHLVKLVDFPLLQ